MSTLKWFNRFLLAFFNTTAFLSLTEPMLLKYPAGSTCGSGVFGMGIFGMVGIDILEKPGVAGDLREDYVV